MGPPNGVPAPKAGLSTMRSMEFATATRPRRPARPWGRECSRSG
jgi:hypothetical protein